MQEAVAPSNAKSLTRFTALLQAAQAAAASSVDLDGSSAGGAGADVAGDQADGATGPAATQQHAQQPRQHLWQWQHQHQWQHC